MLKLGEKQEITTADGRTWTLSRLELQHVRAFRDWVAQRVGDPFERAERLLGKVGDEKVMVLIREAEQVRDQLRAFSIGSPLAQQYLANEEGLTRLVELLLKKHHPQATEEDAFEVALTVNRRVGEVLERAQGVLPPNADGPA